MALTTKYLQSCTNCYNLFQVIKSTMALSCCQITVLIVVASCIIFIIAMVSSSVSQLNSGEGTVHAGCESSCIYLKASFSFPHIIPKSLKLIFCILSCDVLLDSVFELKYPCFPTTWILCKRCRFSWILYKRSRLFVT